MSMGEWELTLVPDTPREIRDKITGFSEVIVFEGRVRAEDMSDTLIADALFRGTVFRPGPSLTIGGHGPACWLGWGERYPNTNLSGLSFPYLNVISQTGSNLATWIAWVCSDTPITVGTVTDPTSGSQLAAKSVQWISQRELLDTLCKEWEVEWRINSELELDVGPFTTLWPSPTAVITPKPVGREIGWVGIEGIVNAERDLWGYASQLYLLGSSTLASAGTYSPFYAPDGKRIYVTAVFNEADVQLNATSFAASRLITTINNPSQRHSITVSSDMFNVSGDLAPGSRVWIYDPEAGIIDDSFSINPIEWRGETIYPWPFRCLGVRWPVRDGMGVMLRRHTGNTAVDLTGTKEYVDLTPYVQWESGGSELTIAYQRSLHWRP
jgi:hypothetical protein